MTLVAGARDEHQTAEQGLTPQNLDSDPATRPKYGDSA